MSISHARPHLRRRFIPLATLAAAGLAIASFGAPEAQAHGTCTAEPGIPYKTASGNIRSDARYTCTNSHRFLTLTAGLEKLKGGAWKPIKQGRPSQGGPGTEITASVIAPCSDTDNYRGTASGFTGTDSDTSAHPASVNKSAPTVISCTTSDLTNTAALLELLLFI